MYLCVRVALAYFLFLISGGFQNEKNQFVYSGGSSLARYEFMFVINVMYEERGLLHEGSALHTR